MNMEKSKTTKILFCLLGTKEDVKSLLDINVLKSTGLDNLNLGVLKKNVA